MRVFQVCYLVRKLRLLLIRDWQPYLPPVQWAYALPKRFLNWNRLIASVWASIRRSDFMTLGDRGTVVREIKWLTPFCFSCRCVLHIFHLPFGLAGRPIIIPRKLGFTSSKLFVAAVMHFDTLGISRTSVFGMAMFCSSGCELVLPLCWFDLMICWRDAHDMSVLMMLRTIVTVLVMMVIIVSVDKVDVYSAAMVIVSLLTRNGAILSISHAWLDRECVLRSKWEAKLTHVGRVSLLPDDLLKAAGVIDPFLKVV